MRIGDREISAEHPPYVIAEIGVNHDGDAERARQLVRAAADAGADAVKFQLFDADLLMSRSAKLAAYQRASGESDPIEMLRRLSLGVGQLAPAVEEARARGVHAIVTVFSLELVEQAERLPWDAYKTASPDIVHRPLLDRLASTGRPMVVSTGASTLAEVSRAVSWLTPIRERVALLQCVSAYPTPEEESALEGIPALADVFGGPIGYSDHTASVWTPLPAVVCGAVILEKHLTYDRTAKGPDHAASLTPDRFARYVKVARSAYELCREGVVARRECGPRARGFGITPNKTVRPIEADVRQVSRQSVTTRRAIGAGEVIAASDLTFKRPGTGIEPWRAAEVVGRRAARPLDADVPVTENDVS